MNKSLEYFFVTESGIFPQKASSLLELDTEFANGDCFRNRVDAERYYDSLVEDSLKQSLDR